MNVISRQLPDSILVMPNAQTVFGDRAVQAPLEIAGLLTYGDTAEVFLTQLGAIGLKFLEGGPLASIDLFDVEGTGAVPDYVTQRRDEVVALQGRRLLFANFVAAALFGRIAGLRHSPLSGAASAGMNDILCFKRHGDMLAIEQTAYTRAVLGRKLDNVRTNSASVRIAPAASLADAVQFTQALAAKEAEFAFANLQVCMAMNYQAAILHAAQHAPASFTLNFSVAEALVNEIFFACGAVDSEPRKGFATRSHSVPTVSRKTLRSMTMAQKLTALGTGGIIEPYLVQRLHAARTLRNDLMHGAVPVAVTQSGPLQTAVRDLWALLIDGPFELIAGYAMRW